ncbi:hypothetical protein [Moorena sp. SIO4G3]|uniref:hypothetical protein n=1 Tax=Moorena sp. SIO4G3 TaxID=2607821 RepID=UPI001429729C|nr:hypothetical protein [Moorena sp. SIO4G3]NEO80585.1 hypothetical protein [Moorena sp. SIO4G3]
MEPLSALAIASLAFIGTKAAETTVEKFTDAALEKAKPLRQKIIDKLSSDPRAEVALLAAQDASETDVEVISYYLQEAMEEDAKFAHEIEGLAREINNFNQVERENWQVSGDVNYNKVSGDVIYNNKNQDPVIKEAGSGNMFNITYNNNPEPY